MPRLGRNFSQGFQHEASLMHGGMWDGQPLRLDSRVPKEQDIDVDIARTFFLFAPASHFLFQGKNSLQQVPGRFLCLQSQRAIEKPRLCRKLDGFGLKDETATTFPRPPRPLIAVFRFAARSPTLLPSER